MSFDPHRLYVRVDASPELGLGHFMRCYALAQYWRDRGGAVTVIGHLPAPLTERLAQEGIVSRRIERPHPDASDSAQSLQWIPTGVPAVLDGYHFDGAYQNQLGLGRRLLVVDDSGHLDAYGGYALLNQNLHADTVAYARAPKRRLLGTRYTLLRRSIRERAKHPPVIAKHARKLLLSVGGADADNYTLELLKALDGLETDQRFVRVVCGPLSPHRDALEAACASRAWAQLVCDPVDMAESLAWADLAICGAGSICWELAALGLPAVLVAMADNQVPLGVGLHERAAAVYSGAASQLACARVVETARRLIDDHATREKMSACGRALVDGRGVVRVGAVLGMEEEE